jgi:uncharacterized RDD family membrane protein YckC
MTVIDQFVNDVLSKIPVGPRREQIEMDLRGHIAERVEAGQSVEEAIRQFGDPGVLADSYLASIPLVSASFWRRTAAKLVDIPGVIIAVCAVAWTGWALFGPGDTSFLSAIRAVHPAVVGLCIATVVLVIPGYFVIAEYLTGQTLGKSLLGIQVVRESGARISLGQSFVRQLPLIGEFFLLDVLFALFTEKNQRAFELITKTRVVRLEEAT